RHLRFQRPSASAGRRRVSAAPPRPGRVEHRRSRRLRLQLPCAAWPPRHPVPLRAGAARRSRPQSAAGSWLHPACLRPAAAQPRPHSSAQREPGRPTVDSCKLPAPTARSGRAARSAAAFPGNPACCAARSIPRLRSVSWRAPDQRRAAHRVHSSQGGDDLPPGRLLPHGTGRGCGGGCNAARARRTGAARGGRFDHADAGQRQHQRTHDHDRREGGATDSRKHVWRCVRLGPSIDARVKGARVKSRTPPAQDDVSAEEYRRLFEAMSEGVLVQDASGRVLTCNSAGQRILGLTIEEMRGRTTAEQVEVELVHEDGTPYAPHDYPSLAALRKGQPRKRMIVGVRRKDRPLVWISVDATPLISKGAERPHGVVSVFHDLSERRRAEAVLRASYDELMDLYNNAPCGYHSLDRNGVYVRVNDTELGWLGMRREDVIGKLCFADVLSPADAERFVQGFPEFVQSGDVRQEEVDLQPREGAQRHVLLHAKALRDAAGRFIYSRTTMYDITQRKAAEQDTRRLNQLLEQRV